MEEIKKSGFKLDAFTVSKFSIERNPIPQGDSDSINLTIFPSALYHKNDSTFTLFMNIELKDENDSFSLKMEGIGNFKLRGDIEEKVLNTYFYTNAPAIIYPYLRAYISSVTALSGLSAVNIPTMVLAGLKEELKKNTNVIE